MRFKNLFVLLHAKIAVPVFHDLMRSSRIKSGNQFPVFILSDRNCALFRYRNGFSIPTIGSIGISVIPPIRWRFWAIFFSLKRSCSHNLASVTDSRRMDGPQGISALRGVRTARSGASGARSRNFSFCFDHFTSARSPMTVSFDKDGIALHFPIPSPSCPISSIFHRQYIIF